MSKRPTGKKTTRVEMGKIISKQALSLALGLVAVVGALAIWMSRPDSPSPTSSEPTILGGPGKPIGRSALSHGGPTPATPGDGSTPAQHSLAHAPLTVGQRAVVVTGLFSIPTGTEVEILALSDADEAVGSVPRFYQVRLPNGRTGWLPEHSLRPVSVPYRSPARGTP